MEEDLHVVARLTDELSKPLAHVREEVAATAAETRHAGKSAHGYGSALEGLAKSGRGTIAWIGQGLRKAARLGATALAAAAVGAVLLGRKLIKLGADAFETNQKFETVFGRNSAAVTSWITKTNAAYGITTKALQDVTSKFAVFGKSAGIATGKLPGFSTRLAQAGLDLSSFYNVEPEQVFDALQSGLAGQVRPLRQFGIFLSENAVKAQAATMGLTGTLTDQQKVVVRNALILKQLGDANGDLARTHDSLANRTRALKGRFEELGTKLGTALIPVAQRFVSLFDRKLGPVVTRLTKAAPKFQDAWDRALKLGDWRSLATLIDGILGGKGKWIKPIERAGNALTHLFRSGAASRGLHSAMHLLGVIIGRVMSTAHDLWILWRDGLGPAVTDLGHTFGGILSPVGLTGSALHFVARNARTLEPLIEALVAGWAAYKIITLAAAAAQWYMNAAAAANPYVILAVALVALGVLFVKLYQHNQRFHRAIDNIGHVFRAVFGWVLRNWKELALVLGALVVGPIGWVIAGFVLLYRHVKPVRDIVKAIGRVTLGGLKSALHWIASKLEAIAHAAKAAGHWISHLPGAGIIKSGIHAITGDTRHPVAAHAGGRLARRASTRNLSHTLGVHNRVDAATPGRRLITSSVRNHSLGSPNSDHKTGRALDLVGDNLGGYARNLRAAGGFAEFHGSGETRHLHAAIGDTSRPMTGSGDAAGGTLIVFQAGAIVIENPSSEIDVARAIQRGIRDYERERQERALPR